MGKKRRQIVSEELIRDIGIPQPIPTDVHYRITQIKNRMERCFEIAGKFVMENEGWNLIHQTYSLKGRKTGHAWAEGKDLVYDPGLDSFFLKSDYDAYRKREANRLNAKPIKVCNSKEMSKFLIRYKHWGPWE